MERFLKISFSFCLLLIVNCSLFIDNCFSQWVQQTLPVNKPITGIEFVDTSHGWACTSRGTPADTGYILNTTNGGANWLVQLSVSNLSFIDIDMLNSLTGFAAGNDFNISLFKLFKTTNTGANWTSITMVPNMNIADIQFINQDSGWECGPNFTADVRTTTDGGNNWIIRNSGINQSDALKVFFLNYNTGFCGGVGWLFKTTNAGLNWSSNGVFGQSVRGVFFLNINTGWLGLSNGRIASTTNGGVNWTIQQPISINSSNTYDIYFLNNSIGYAGTGWFQTIFKTTNGGINWGYQFVPTGSVRISIIDTLKAWCADIGISHTSNGGGYIIYDGINKISSDIPKEFELYQNYPNPFNPLTIIKFAVKPEIRNQKSKIKIIVYDISGKLITVLVNNELLVGEYETVFKGTDYSTGIYFCTLLVNGNFIDTKKMILLK